MKIRASNFLDAFFMPILERGENRGRSVSVVGPMVILVLFSVCSIDTMNDLNGLAERF